jgi:hypothetical protein
MINDPSPLTSDYEIVCQHLVLQYYIEESQTIKCGHNPCNHEFKFHCRQAVRGLITFFKYSNACPEK